MVILNQRTYELYLGYTEWYRNIHTVDYLKILRKSTQNVNI